MNLSRVSCKMLLLAGASDELKVCSFLLKVEKHWQVIYALHTAYSASWCFPFHLGFGPRATNCSLSFEGAVATSLHEDA